MEIRLANENDTDALYELNELFNGPGTSREHIRRSLGTNEREIVCIAVQNGIGAGYCCAQQIRSMCYDRDFAEIEELYVQPEFRRRGVGEKLMALMEETLRAKGITHFHLCTGVKNLPARSLYEKVGFTDKGDMQYTK